MSADLQVAALPTVEAAHPHDHPSFLGAITATFSIRTDAEAPVVDAVRAILAARYLEPRRVRSRSSAGTALVTVEQPGTNEAEARVVLDQIRSLARVHSAELECQLERKAPSLLLQAALDQVRTALEEVRIDVI